MKALRWAAPALALLLLAGCQQPAADSPSPSPDASPVPSYQVTTHWDALTERPAPLVSRWYEGYTDDLIPSDDYGQLVPYIGGEASAEGWGTNWTYGLATRDGVIVTDPVFLEVQPLTYYDYGVYQNIQTPVLLLRKAGIDPDKRPDEAGYFYDRYGLAALDGSWYTGLAYSAVICQSELGALLFDLQGDVVMVGLDGQERWRWAAGDIPLPGLVPQAYYWEEAATGGPYLRYITQWNDDGWPDYLYVDLRTGQVLDQAPADYPQDIPYEDGVGYYTDGWYEQADGVLTIHTDGGQDHTMPFPQGFDYPEINGDRIIFHSSTYTAGDDRDRSLVTDLNGNELLRSGQYLNFVWQQWGDVPSLMSYTVYDEDYVHSRAIVLDRDGNELLTAQDYSLTQFGDRLLYVSEYFYHLADLEGNDLLRIPRWSSLDLPADD